MKMSGNCLNFEDPIEDAITRVKFAPNSNNLLISSWDCTLRLYDVDSSQLRLEAQSEAAVFDCCFESESVAYSACSDGSISRYDLRSRIHSTIGNHDDSASCIAYSHGTCQVITSGWDRKIMCWDSRNAKGWQCLTNLSSDVECISLNGSDLLVGTGSSVYKYDLRKLNGAVEAEHMSMGVRIRCICSIPQPKGFAVGSIDGRVALKYSDEMGYTFRCHPRSRNGKHHLVAVNDIAFNPLAFGAFVTGDYEGHVIAWDAKSRKRLLELPRYPQSVASLSYNHTGELLAVASSYMYQEANEKEGTPQIFIEEMSESYMRSTFASNSSAR